MPGHTLDRHLSLGRVIGVAASPDGAWLAVEVQRLDKAGAKYISDLWRVSVAGDVPPRRLTFGDAGASSPRFRPDGALAFLSTRPVPGEAGDPVTQVWCLPAEGGEAVPLTSEALGVVGFRFGGDTLLAMVLVWPDQGGDDVRTRWQARAKEGPSILRYSGAARARHWDAWMGPLRPELVVYRLGERRALSGDLGQALHEAPFELSPDGALAVAAVEVPGRSGDGVHDAELRAWDVATGACRTLLARPGELVVGIAFFPDGEHLALVVEERPAGRAPPMDLRVLDARDGTWGTAAELGELWPLEVVCGDDGATVFLAAQRHGRGVVARLDLGSEALRQVTEEGSFDHLVALPGGGVAGIFHTILHPPEPAVLRGARGDDAPVRVGNLSGWKDDEAAAVVEELATRGADGSPVHGFVVRPREGATGAGLLWVHGGPIGAHADGWHWRWSPLLATSLGYTVALPNPRGSSGYGTAFIDGVWANRYGEACYTDLLAFTDAFVARPDVDAARVAALGGSFGGYMVNWMGGQTDRFCAYVSHAGLWHFEAFLASDLPAWWRLEQTPVGGSGPDLATYSPHRFASAWRRPLLLLHGERDYRVPVSEALLAYEALRHHGVDAELVIFPDENHWIRRPRNIRAWYEAIWAFLSRHVPPG